MIRKSIRNADRWGNSLSPDYIACGTVNVLLISLTLIGFLIRSTESTISGRFIRIIFLIRIRISN